MAEVTAAHQPPAIEPFNEYPVRVLLVDDQAVIGEAIRRMLLTQPEIAFHYCGNPEEAIESALRIKPTIILQDLVMPHVDGLTLLSRYRAHPVVKDIPIIVLSTNGDPTTKSAAFSSGANDYLVKLPDEIELVARIKLHSRAYLNQIQRDEAYRALHESRQELVARNAELARLASTDMLTGLCSRRRWFELSAIEFGRHRRYRQPLALMMADLDFFKRVNDTFGHDTGDRALRQFADVLRVGCRQSDVVGRLGGEEFVALLPGAGISAAAAVARRVVESCRDIVIPTAAGSVTFTCSIGITAATEADDTFEALIPRADAALYEAKQAGRDRWIVNQMPTPAVWLPERI